MQVSGRNEPMSQSRNTNWILENKVNTLPGSKVLVVARSRSQISDFRLQDSESVLFLRNNMTFQVKATLDPSRIKVRLILRLQDSIQDSNPLSPRLCKQGIHFKQEFKRWTWF